MKHHQLASTRPQGWFYVNWWLMNHCSWSCSYCNDLIRNSSINLPYINDCRNFLDQADRFARVRGLRLHLEFTGGEVTEWNQFLELITYANNDLDALVKFRSNASTAIAQWQEYMKHTDIVLLEIHPQHTQLSHFFICVQSARDQDVEVNINVNMLPERWEELESTLERIQNRWPEIVINRKMLFVDPVYNTQPKDYSESQIHLLKNQKQDLIYTSGKQQEYSDYQTLVLEGRNQFTGWKCNIGLEQIIVDAWGHVYKGHCRKNGYMGLISQETLHWPSEPMICDLPLCRNAFDIQATKNSI